MRLLERLVHAAEQAIKACRNQPSNLSATEHYSNYINIFSKYNLKYDLGLTIAIFDHIFREASRSENFKTTFSDLVKEKHIHKVVLLASKADSICRLGIQHGIIQSKESAKTTFLNAYASFMANFRNEDSASLHLEANEIFSSAQNLATSKYFAILHEELKTNSSSEQIINMHRLKARFNSQIEFSNQFREAFISAQDKLVAQEAVITY